MTLELTPKRRAAASLPASRAELDPEIDWSGWDSELELETRRRAQLKEFLEGRASGSLEQLLEGLRGSPLLELLEGKHWDPDKHPRWPANAPGGVGGQFMHVGQRFRFDGVDWDIAMVEPGHIWAYRATKGKHTEAELREFTPAELKFNEKNEAQAVERPPAEEMKGSGNAFGATKNITVTVIDPYVHPETHDDSIPIPEGSKITPEEWKRFGKADQEKYAQVMERFGPYVAKNVQTMLNSRRKQMTDAQQKLLEQAYYQQFYYQNVGFSLSMHGFAPWLKGKLGSAETKQKELEKQRAKYEEAKECQAELTAIIQWDLFNRTHSPDLAIFKGHGNPDFFTNEVIKGGVPIYAGASFSQQYRPGSFGSDRFMSSLGIRNIAMATVSGYATETHAFHGEQEVALSDPWLADPKRTLSIADVGSYGHGSYTHQKPSNKQATWLQKITLKGASGAVIDELLSSYSDDGVNLSLPPEPPSIKMDTQGGFEYEAPPAEAIKEADVDGVKTPIADLLYAETTPDGKPVAKRVKDMVDLGELHAGDYIEGMQGTRYIVVPSKSDPYLGLAYYKITDTGQAVPGTEFSTPETNQTSSAFTGHKPHTSVDCYSFEGGGTKAFKKLTGHYEFQAQSEETTGFYPEAWAEGGKDDEKLVSKFKAGEKFVVSGTPYEVVAPGDVTKIQNLDSGKYGQVTNASFTKLPPLMLKAGYSETGEAKLDPADFFSGEIQPHSSSIGQVVMIGQTLHKVSASSEAGKVTLTQMSGTAVGKQMTVVDSGLAVVQVPKPAGWSPPQVGDTFSFAGKKATVTKLLKSGEIQAKTAEGSKRLKPDDPLFAYLHRPSDWQVGPKTKLKDLGKGERFHGGTGATIRPYVVTGFEGKNVTVRNLDTGEEMPMSGNKSFSKLVAVTHVSTAPPEDHVTPTQPAETFDPDAWEKGDVVAVKALMAGDKFYSPAFGTPFEVISTSDFKGEPNMGEVKNLITGEHAGYKAQDATAVNVLEPKQAAPAPAPEPAAPAAAEWQQSVSGLTTGDLEIGDQFAVSAADDATVWEVTGQDAESTQFKIVKTVSPELVGTEGVTAKTFEPSYVKKAAPAPAVAAEGLQPNKKKLGDLPVGTLIQATPSADYVQSAAVFKVVDQSGYGLTKVEVVTPLVYKPGYDMPAPSPAGEQNTFDKKMVFSLAAPPTEAPKPKAKPAPAPGTPFNPSAYSMDTQTKASTLTLGDLTKGEIFKGKTGKHFQINSVSGKNVYATNLDTGKKTKLAATIKPAAILHPKASPPSGPGHATPYEELKPGDPTTLGELKKGDQFELLDSGQLYEVMEPSGGKDEQNATIAPVAIDGSLGKPEGAKSAGKTSPLTKVKLHAKAADKVQMPAGQADQLAEPPVGLPEVLEVDYASTTATGPQLWTMTKGTVFEDENQIAYVVKVPGSNPIVSDGEQLWQINGGWHGKVITDTDWGQQFAKSDTQPDFPQTHQEVKQTLAASGLAPNTAGADLFDLGIYTGDTFQVNGEVWVAQSPADSEELVSAYQPATGKTKSWASSTVPEAWKLGHGEDLIVPEPEPATAMPEIPTPPAGALANVLPLSSLGVGTEFTHPDYPGAVLQVEGKIPSKVYAHIVKPDTAGKLVPDEQGYLSGKPLSFEPDLVPPLVGKVGVLSGPEPGGAPVMPYDPVWLPNEDNLDVAALKVGDRFVWGGSSYQLTGKNEAGVPIVAALEGGGGDFEEQIPHAFGAPNAVPEKVWFPQLLEPLPSEKLEIPSHLASLLPSEAKDHFDETGKGHVSELTAGEFFKSVVGNVFMVDAVPGEDTATVKMVGGDGESMEVVPSAAVTFVKPKDGGIPAVPTPEGWEPAGTSTVGDLSPGDQFTLGKPDIDVIWKVKGLGDVGDQTQIEAVSGGGGAFPPGHTMSQMNDTPIAYVKKAAVPAGPAVGDPLLPSQAQVGDYIATGIYGGTYQITAISPPDAATPSFNVKLKNVETGVEGSGYYYDATADWKKAAPPEFVEAPAPSGALNPVQQAHAEPMPERAKALKEFEVGDIVQSTSYNGGVFKILQLPPEGYTYGSTKVEVVKPPSGYGQFAKVGDVGNMYGYYSQLYVPHPGTGPMWKLGEIAKVVKPGNKTGKSAKVVGYDGTTGIKMQYADGKTIIVEHDWLQSIKPTYKTLEKLAPAKRPVKTLEVGDLFTTSAYYAQPSVVTKKNTDGSIEAKTWGSKTISPISHTGEKQIYLVASAKQLASYSPETGGALAPSPTEPEVPGEATHTLGDLEVGAMFTMPSATDPSQQWVVAKAKTASELPQIKQVGEPAGSATFPLSGTVPVHLVSGSAVSAPTPPEPLPPSATHTMSQLDPGAVFQLTQSTTDPDKQWIVTKTGDDDPNNFVYAKSLGGTDTPIPFGSDVPVKLLAGTASGISEPSALAAMGAPATPDSPAFKPNTQGLTIDQLTPGDRFVHAGGVFEVVEPDADGPRALVIKPLVGETAVPAGKTTSWSPGGPPFEKVWHSTPTPTPAAGKMLLMEMSPYTQFEVGPAFQVLGVPDGTYELMPSGFEPPDGTIAPPDAGEPGTDFLWAQNVATGSYEWFGSSLEAPLVSGPALQGPSSITGPSKSPGSVVDSVEHLQSGDYFTSGLNGNVFRVDEVEPVDAATTKITVTLTASDEQQKDIGQQFIQSYPNTWSGTSTWHYAEPVEPKAEPPAADVVSSDPDDYYPTGNKPTLFKMTPGSYFKYETTPVVYKVESVEMISATQGSADIVDVSSGKKIEGVYADEPVIELDYSVKVPKPVVAGFLVPYQWPKSGKKKFPKISTLKPGTQFQDKSHKTYTVVGKGTGGIVHFKDAAGNEHTTPGDSRVYVTMLPPASAY